MWKKFLIYFICSSLSSGVALWLLQTKLKKSSEQRSLPVIFFFLTNFVCAFGLYALLLQEILCFKNLANQFETQLWNLQISVLNFNILFLGPFLLLKRVTDRIKYNHLKKIIFWVVFLVYFYYLARKLNQEVLSLQTAKQSSSFVSFFANVLSKEAQFNLLGAPFFSYSFLVSYFLFPI